jgi:hypothetical protein
VTPSNGPGALERTDPDAPSRRYGGWRDDTVERARWASTGSPVWSRGAQPAFASSGRGPGGLVRGVLSGGLLTVRALPRRYRRPRRGKFTPPGKPIFCLGERAQPRTVQDSPRPASTPAGHVLPKENHGSGQRRTSVRVSCDSYPRLERSRTVACRKGRFSARPGTRLQLGRAATPRPDAMWPPRVSASLWPARQVVDSDSIPDSIGAGGRKATLKAWLNNMEGRSSVRRRLRTGPTSTASRILPAT